MHAQIGDVIDFEQRIDLYFLMKGIGCITPAFGESCAEAGAVCLEDQGHKCGARLSVSGSLKSTFELHWACVQELTRRCYGDAQMATEYGAYGIAFLLIRRVTDFTVIERSMKGPGFDYWLGHDEDDLFQRKARLEVSGIRHGSEGDVNSRVKQKMEQTTPSDAIMLPAYVVVVEFSNPQSKIIKK